jgi:hypothetical protein
MEHDGREIMFEQYYKHLPNEQLLKHAETNN